MHRALIAPFVLLLAATGCSGVLIVNQAVAEGTPCVTSVSCGPGQACAAEACITIIDNDWCACSATQGCIAGVCVDVDDDNDCTPERPDGACLNEDVCVGGYCVPITDSNLCTHDNPNGLCPPGSACADGACVPIVSRECSLALPTGLCEPGQTCNAGTCEVVACSSIYPYGACGVDEVCDAGECETVPCGPGHLGGFCEEGSFCSVAGTCTINGTCLDVGDCDERELCISGACERDYHCTADENCDQPAEHCLVSISTCAAADTCRENMDCETGDKCAVADFCIAESACYDDRDCATGTEFCSATKTCLSIGDCASDGDCAPGYECNTTSHGCEVKATAERCTTNDYTFQQTVGCAAGSLYCCPTGQTCCLDDANKLDPAQHCSLTDGVCMPDGSCLVDADCLSPSFVCAADHTCQPAPASACSGETCGAGMHCSDAGACIPLGQCVLNADCATENVDACMGDYTCTPLGCGFTEGTAAAVKPNMLIVLDRSGSMEVTRGTAVSGQCCGMPGETVGGAGQYCEIYPDCSDYTTLGTCNSIDYYIAGTQFCAWNAGAGRCDPTCSLIGTSGACNTQLGCQWDTDTVSCVVHRPATRWQQALTALEEVVTGFSNRVRFGLTYYPQACPGAACARHGNWCSCDGLPCVSCSTFNTDEPACREADSCAWSGGVCQPRGNCYPGEPNVVVGDNTPAVIMSELFAVHPGGSTPTGPTLRVVRDARASFGLSVGVDCAALAQIPCGSEPQCGWSGTACVSHCELIGDSTACGLASDCVWDTGTTSCLKQQDRGDYVLLVTDGEANCDDDCATAIDSGTCTARAEGCTWTGSLCKAIATTYAPKVNSALDDLRALTPEVKTYVVGFAFSTVSANLNCHAAYGGTARPDTCAGVTTSTCSSAPNACYYDASDASTLSAALGNILGTVALCSVTVEGLRSNDFVGLTRVNVYLNHTDGSGAEWIARDTSGLTSWNFDLTDTYARINFAGAACDVIRAGTVTPLIINACGGEGG